jgi:DNA-binding CsgD family transcriptional regulator
MPQKLIKQMADFRAEIATMRTAKAVIACSQRLIARYGVNVFAAGVLPRDAAQLHFENWDRGSNLWFGETIPASYWPECQKGNAEFGWDAITLKSQNAMAPFTFSEARREKPRRGSWVFDLLPTIDIADGLFVPLRGGNVVLSSPQILRLHPDLQDTLVNVTIAMAKRLATMVKTQARGRSLTAREIEVVQMLVRCKTNRRVAQEMDLSPKTIAEHLRNVRRKTQTDATLNAVLELYSRGLITR